MALDPAVPDATLLVLSDLHLREDGPLLGVVDGWQRLDAALGQAADASVPVDALVLAGDLADDGAPAGYGALVGRLREAAGALDARLVVLPGNHDDPAGLLAALAPQVTFDAVCDLGAVRVATLDSVRPGRDTGHLEPERVDRLAAALAAGDGPVVLVTHHSPLPSPEPMVAGLGMDDEAHAGLARLVTAAPVRLVVCGHTHTPAFGTVAGVPVVTAPALAYTADALSPAGHLRLWDAGGLLRVDVFGERVVALPVALPPGPTVAVRARAEVDARLQELRAAGRA